MEPYLSKALRRAGTKLAVGLAVLAAIVGLRFVTAKPAGLESDLAELERFDAEQAAAEAGEGSVEAADASATGADGSSDAGATTAVESDDASASESALRSGGAGADAVDLDRLVRCWLHGERQYMRAADCATRGGTLEELPPPPPEDAAEQP